MGFTFTSILLATLAATMAPNPSLAVVTDFGLDKMVDMQELEVTVDYRTTHKTFGLAEAACFEKAIVEAINAVYLEDEWHAYGAKVTHSSRRPATLSDVLQGQQDLAMLDDVVELAEEALALEALVMDDEGVTIEEVRTKMSNLRGLGPWYRKMWVGSSMLTTMGNCRLCAPEESGAEWLAQRSNPSKRKNMEKLIADFLAQERFVLGDVVVDIKYKGREFDPPKTVEEDRTEKGDFAPVLEGAVLAGAFAAN
jgi:hypothetical protein